MSISVGGATFISDGIFIPKSLISVVLNFEIQSTWKGIDVARDNSGELGGQNPWHEVWIHFDWHLLIAPLYLSILLYIVYYCTYLYIPYYILYTILYTATHCILLCILVNTLWLTLTDRPIPTLASMSNKGLSTSRNILWSLDLSKMIFLSESFMSQVPAYCLVWPGSDQAAEICWEIMQCVDDPDPKVEDT